jgi:hypothetical protein
LSPRTSGEKESIDRFAWYPPPVEYQAISGRLKFYLQNWFDMIERYQPAYELLFGTISERVYPVNEFLSLSQALEAYHSRKFENRIVSDDLFNKPKSKFLRIINELPVEHRPEFQSKVEFMNRKTLRRRTKELFAKHHEIFKIFIENENDFTAKFVAARNYYTHYDPEMKKPVEIIEIPFLTENLRLMLMVILFKEMGLETEQIKQTIHRYCRNRIKAIYQ